MTNLTELLVDLPLLASILFKITVVLGASWILHLALVPKNPRWRIVLWRCAITGLVLIPLLVPFAYLQISITPPPEQVVIATSEPTVEYPIIETPSFSDAGPVQISRPVVSDMSEPSFSPTAWFRANTWMIVSIVWASIAAILLLRLLSGLLQIRKKIKSSLAGPEHLQRLLHRVTNDLGCTQKIDLRYAPDMPTPFLTGLLRPIIILPERMIDGKYESKWEAIFAHEAAHLKSRDLHWMFVIRWFEIILWFHPFVWKLRSIYGAACEEVSDAVAADYIGNTESYSSTLASLALEVIGKVPVIGGIPMARSSEILARLRILKQRIYPAGLARRWVILSGLVSFIALTVIGGLSLVYAESDANKSATSILHFPKDQSLGALKIATRKIASPDYVDYYYGEYEWEYFADAVGNVSVPADEQIMLEVLLPSKKNLSLLSKLKPDDLDMLVIAGFGDHVLNPDETIMPHISNLTGLKALMIVDIDFSNNGLKFIENFNSLKYLRLGSKKITNTGLKHLKRLNSLEGLVLISARINDLGLRHLAELKSLSQLRFICERIRGSGLAHLAILPKLRYLNLWSEKFSDTGLKHLKNISNLKRLKLRNVPITDAGLEHLSNLKELEDLDLYKTQVTDEGLIHLKKMSSLKKLNLWWTKITDNGLVHIGELKSLEYLDLPNESITDEGLAKLLRLNNLKHLRVGCSGISPITDAGVKHVSSFHLLKELYIGGTGISDIGMNHLSKLTNLKNLAIEYSAPSLSNQGLSKLTSLKALSKLTLPRTKSHITIAGLANLNALVNLTELHVPKIRQDNTGMNIAGLTKLEKLGISSTPGICDDDLICLEKLTSLKSVQLNYRKANVSDTGMSHLAGLTSIEKLAISGPNLTDTGLTHLANMKQLNYLKITGNFTDKGLRHFANLKALQHLKIYSANNFSPAALKRLKEKLPNLRTFTAKLDRARDTKK